MSLSRIEKFHGYCPTQDKFEIVEQTFIDLTTHDSEIRRATPGLMTCPYIYFRNGNCNIFNNCPVLKGEWGSMSPEVFVAMQYETPEGRSRDILEKVIMPVCAGLGLKAFIVSDKEHNELIYDVIIKSIMKSRFIIADLTYNNNGAYYEAGYAKGLGKKVIHTCSKEWHKNNKIHFNLTGFNTILYEDDDDFKIKLKNRIVKTCLDHENI